MSDRLLVLSYQQPNFLIHKGDTYMLDFLKDAKESESTEYQKIHFKTIEYKIEYLLSSLESLTEDEINIIIKENYKIFLTTMKDTENIRRLFTNVK